MTKKEALAIIIKCAKAYNNNLNNKNLLFVAINQNKKIYTFEVTFNSSNYLHLTGIKKIKEITGKNIAPRDFFKRCLNNKVSLENFEIAKDGTTELKLKVLPKLISPNLSAKMIGNFDGRNIKLYTERITGSTYGCIGFRNNINDHCNYPNTVLNDDIRKNVDHADRILITYRKDISETLYSEIVYKANGYDFSDFEVPDYPYLKFE